MSVYSGFSTRLQESAYNLLLESLLSIFQEKVMATVIKKAINEQQWEDRFLELYYQLSRLEVQKYMHPKLSLSVRELAKHIVNTRRQSLILPPLSELPEAVACGPVSLPDRKYISATPHLHRSVSKVQDQIEEKRVNKSLESRSRSIKLHRVRSKRQSPELLFGKKELEWVHSKQMTQRYYNRLLLKKLQTPHEPNLDSLMTDSLRSVQKETHAMSRKATT